MNNLVPDGWYKTKIGDVLEIVNDRYEMKDEEHYPLLSVRRRNGGFFNREMLQGKNILTKTLSKAIPESFVISKMQVVHGACGIITEPFYNGFLSASYVSFLSKNNKTHLPYFNYLCHMPEMIKLFLLSSHGVHIEKMTFDIKDWLSREIVIPPLPEQKRIAKILTSVDEVIEKTQAQIDKLKDLKTGMMQELLTRGVGVDGKPHTEFKDSPVGRIPKVWEVVKLSSVLSKIDSGWSPACIEVPPATGEWGVVKVSAVTRGRFLEKESKTLPKELKPKSHIQIKRGDILLTRANGVADLVGKCVMVSSEPKAKLMMSDKILRLNANGKVYSKFLLHYFNSRQIRKQIELSWGGSSGQKNISQADIKGYFIALPSLNEQMIIGDSISQIDTLLSVREAKLRKLEDSKKALMQDLLTGNVRVKVED